MLPATPPLQPWNVTLVQSMKMSTAHTMTPKKVSF